MNLRVDYNLGPNPLLTKTMEIGPWNMDATEFVTVLHGLAFAQIREVSACVYNDFLTTGYPFEYSESYAEWDGTIIWGASSIALYRRTGGWFMTTSFDDAVMNRGFIIIRYVQ